MHVALTTSASIVLPMRRFLTLIGAVLGTVVALAPGSLGDKAQKWSLLLAESAESAVSAVGAGAAQFSPLERPWEVAGPLLLAMAPGLAALTMAAISQSALGLTRVLAGLLAVLGVSALFFLDLSQAVLVAIPCALLAGVALVAGGSVVTLAGSAITACLVVCYSRLVLSPEYTEPLSGNFDKVVSSITQVGVPTHILLLVFAWLPLVAAAAIVLRGIAAPSSE